MSGILRGRTWHNIQSFVQPNFPPLVHAGFERKRSCLYFEDREKHFAVVSNFSLYSNCAGITVALLAAPKTLRPCGYLRAMHQKRLDADTCVACSLLFQPSPHLDVNCKRRRGRDRREKENKRRETDEHEKNSLLF